jgi:carbon-monoxide dehydrogenase medium subunit
LTKSFTPEAVEGVAIDASELNGDLHASAAFRAQLVKVQTQRAVQQANG